MEAQLLVPYRDTVAEDLAWRLGEPRRPALAVLTLPVAGGLVELRLLGSSHQILFSNAGDPGVTVSEVVACGAAADGLPVAAQRALGGWDYRFRSCCHELGASRFEPWVDRLVTRLSHHPSAIVGRFPGSPQAVTALAAGSRSDPAGRVHWRTWHAYPQEHRVVVTSTRVQPR